MHHDQRFSNLRLRIEYVPTSSLVPATLNPRLHNARQIKALAKSIDTFGLLMDIDLPADWARQKAIVRIA